jgi:hypothetical protein
MKVYVYRCPKHGDYEFPFQPLEQPRCPECDRLMAFIGVFEELG